MQKTAFTAGALAAGLAVAMGAATGHSPSPFDETARIWLEKAIRYQFLHGLALLLVAMAIKLWPEQRRLFVGAGWGFIFGIVLFCGSLYAMAFIGVDAGYLTPLGGMGFLGGWLAVTVAGLRLR